MRALTTAREAMPLEGFHEPEASRASGLISKPMRRPRPLAEAMSGWCHALTVRTMSAPREAEAAQRLRRLISERTARATAQPRGLPP